MRIHVGIQIALALTAGFSSLGAQTVGSRLSALGVSQADRSGPQLPTADDDDGREGRIGLYPFLGMHFGGPVRASLAGGIGVRSLSPGEPVRFFLVAEPGLRGGRLSLVTGTSVGELASAWTIRGSYLQLWGGAPHRKYGGAELQIIPIFGLGGRVGAFKPLGTIKTDRKILIIADFSFLI
jgi:hypothetical protein